MPLLRLAALALLSGLEVSTAALAEERVPVEVLQLERTEVTMTMHGFGTLERRPRKLYFLVAGNVTELRAQEGDEVREGQPLARLDTELLQIRKARLELSLRHAQLKRERTRKLVARKAISPEALEDRDLEYKTSQLELRDVEEELERQVLRAPGDARVLQRHVDFPGPIERSTAVYTVKLHREPWLVMVDLTQREASGIHRGDAATVSFDGIVGRTFSGTVHDVARHTNTANDLVEVEVEVPLEDIDEARRIGLNARVEFVVATGHSGYRVPVSALDQVANGQAEIFVLDEGGVARRRVVEFVLIPGLGAVVGSDLSAFDAVIVRGQHAIKDGSNVSVAPATER